MFSTLHFIGPASSIWDIKLDNWGSSNLSNYASASPGLCSCIPPAETPVFTCAISAMPMAPITINTMVTPNLGSTSLLKSTDKNIIAHSTPPFRCLCETSNPTYQTYVLLLLQYWPLAWVSRCMNGTHLCQVVQARRLEVMSLTTVISAPSMGNQSIIKSGSFYILNNSLSWPHCIISIATLIQTRDSGRLSDFWLDTGWWDTEHDGVNEGREVWGRK